VLGGEASLSRRCDVITFRRGAAYSSREAKRGAPYPAAELGVGTTYPGPRLGVLYPAIGVAANCCFLQGRSAVAEQLYNGNTILCAQLARRHR